MKPEKPRGPEPPKAPKRMALPWYRKARALAIRRIRSVALSCAGVGVWVVGVKPISYLLFVRPVELAVRHRPSWNNLPLRPASSTDAQVSELGLPASNRIPAESNLMVKWIQVG